MNSDQVSISSLPAVEPTTFLFTDIEGSTQRWERFPEAMRDALRRHDELVRRAIEEYGGRVFKTIGDAFCAAFPTAGGAVAAALRAQRLLLTEDWSAVDGIFVRIALDTSVAQERDDDYFGPGLNKVARLLSIASGGQVLVSHATWLRVAAAPVAQGTAADNEFLDLGEHRLRNIAAPERVYQLVARGLRAAFPPLRSLEQSGHNLSQPVTTFVEQDDALVQIAVLIERHSLVTLLGSGGIGKSRYATEVGRSLLGRFPDGVWFVELAPLHDGDLVASAIANVLRIPEQVATPMLEQLPSALAAKEMLLILDNCEHVVGAAANIVSRLLRSCAGVRILATSREPLEVEGEHTFTVPPLETPDVAVGNVPSIEELRRSPAIRLFLDRASAANPHLAVGPQDAANLTAVCRRLDGIPLAIELAAARMSAMTVAQLGARLDDRFRLLTKGLRTSLPRQQTLRALIDWSFALLSERERRCFAAASVFAGRFSLAAASFVCAEAGEDEWAVFDLIASLTSKSLLIREPESETYRQLETTRYYAAEKLREGAAEHDHLQRHLDYHVRFAASAAARYESTNGRVWQAEVRAALENVRAALQWSIDERHDVRGGIALTAYYCLAWMALSLDFECTERIETALVASDDIPPELRARLLVSRARIGIRSQRPGIAPAREAVTLYRSTRDEPGLAQALNVLGQTLAREQRYDEADRYFEEALALATRIGNVRQHGLALLNLGVNRETAGEFERSRELYESALELAIAHDDDSLIASAHLDLNALCEAIEAFEEGVAHALKALEAYDRAGEVFGGVLALSNLTTTSILLGRMAEARQAARDWAIQARAYRLETSFLLALEAVAGIAQVAGDALASARLLGFTEARAVVLDLKRDSGNARFRDGVLCAIRAQLGADAELRIAEGSAMSESEATNLALTVTSIGSEEEVLRVNRRGDRA